MTTRNRGESKKGKEPTQKHLNGIHKDSQDKTFEDLKGEIKSGGEISELNQAQSGRKCCGLNPITILKAFVLLILIPPFLNYASLQKESRSLRPSGYLGVPSRKGYKLFMNCTGRGQPVVMMDAPGGFSSDIWSIIQPQVAKFTKVCVYDRTGLGFSESHAYSRQWNESNNNERTPKRWYPTVENMADDLRSMLEAVSNESAFVLVGGGVGAINARFYTQMFENIFGLVLINSFHEEMFTESNSEWTTFWYEKFLPSLQLQQILASLGITRLGLLTGLVKPEIVGDDRLSDDIKIRYKYLLCNSGHLTSGIRELYYVNESLTQLKILQKLKPFPAGVSVKVVSSKTFSHFVTSSLNDFWQMNQQLLVNEVFPDCERMLVNGDFNSVYFDDAAVIVKAIQKLVTKFRKSVKQAASF